MILYTEKIGKRQNQITISKASIDIFMQLFPWSLWSITFTFDLITIFKTTASIDIFMQQLFPWSLWSITFTFDLITIFKTKKQYCQPQTLVSSTFLSTHKFTIKSPPTPTHQICSSASHFVSATRDHRDVCSSFFPSFFRFSSSIILRHRRRVASN